MRLALPTLACLLVTLSPLAAARASVERVEAGNRVTENLPAIPAELLERLNQYQNTRGASLAGWLPDGSLLINTRFAETSQVHRVRMPMGMREQLTFYPEPVRGVAAQPAKAGSGFVFGKDVGGNEFWQLHHYDVERRTVRRAQRHRHRHLAVGRRDR